MSRSCWATHANPLFLIDELDKAAAGGNCNPTGPLHSLLEPATSANVVDAMLGITFNARLVIYIATSNDRNKVPESILSRFREFEISPPMGEEALQLARVVVRSAVADAGVRDFAPPEDAWAHKLAFYTPREIGQHVHLAIARAVANNRRHLTAADLPPDPDDPAPRTDPSLTTMDEFSIQKPSLSAWHARAIVGFEFFHQLPDRPSRNSL